MAKSLVLFLTSVALLCAQAVAQGNSKDRPSEQSDSAKQGETREEKEPGQTEAGRKTAEPSKEPGGPTDQPTRMIVPPSGPQVGINPEGQQPQENGSANAGKDQQLRERIEKALQNEPTLTNANVKVVVDKDTITLEGTVANGKDRRTANRIAKSFAGDRKVVDNVKVGPPANPEQQRPAGN